MKTATISSLRVDPELRHAAEDVLQDGESLSSFVEQSLRLNFEHRRAQQTFIARGLASRDAATQSGEYFAAEDILRDLDDLLAQARVKAAG